MTLTEEELLDKMRAAEVPDGLGTFRLTKVQEDGEGRKVKLSRVFEMQEVEARLKDGWEPDAPDEAPGSDAHVPASGFANGDYRLTRIVTDKEGRDVPITNVVGLADVPARLEAGWKPADARTTDALVERGLIDADAEDAEVRTEVTKPKTPRRTKPKAKEATPPAPKVEPKADKDE